MGVGAGAAITFTAEFDWVSAVTEAKFATITETKKK